MKKIEDIIDKHIKHLIEDKQLAHMGIHSTIEITKPEVLYNDLYALMEEVIGKDGQPLMKTSYTVLGKLTVDVNRFSSNIKLNRRLKDQRKRLREVFGKEDNKINE